MRRFTTHSHTSSLQGRSRYVRALVVGLLAKGSPIAYPNCCKPYDTRPPGTAGYSGPDRMYGSMCFPLAVPNYEDVGRVSDSWHEELTFLSKSFSWWTWDSNSRPAAQVLPTTPYVEALVRWAAGRLTNRVPKLLSLITCTRRFS